MSDTKDLAFFFFKELQLSNLDGDYITHLYNSLFLFTIKLRLDFMAYFIPRREDIVFICYVYVQVKVLFFTRL